MKLFGTGRAPEVSNPDEASAGGFATIEGERGIPSVNRARSLQSRVSTILAVGLMSALGVGLLTWYYAHALTQGSRVQRLAQVNARSRAQGEMTLPSLGPITPPALAAAPRPAPPSAPAASVAPPGPSALERVLGPPPPPPPVMPSSPTAFGPAAAVAPAPGASPRPLDRRLSGPVFAKGSGDLLEMPSANAAEASQPVALTGASAVDPPGRQGAEDPLARRLEPSATPAVQARLLPPRRFLLPKGAFIDCTLETAIDSTYPGLTTCVTATDTFSADGTVVLLERGTKLVGETQSGVQQGAARVFVLWTEARTPTGVVVPLASPGTDALGRTGLSGEVNRHFWERFGAAILVTVINGAVQAGVESASGNNGTLVVNPSASQDVGTEVLRDTIAIPPTITVAQGARIEVLVARDVDFRSVYALKTASIAAPAGSTP